MNHSPDHEQDIARVLTSLRSIDPAPGLEHRVLERLQSQPSHTRFWSRWITLRRPRSVTRSRSFALIAAAVVIAIFVLSTHRPSNKPAGRPLSANTLPADLISPQIQQHSTFATKAQQNSVLSTGPRESVANRGSSDENRSSNHSSQSLRLPAHPQTPLCDCDPIALAEMRAPSKPAPAMPLTEQERLMLRVARDHDPAALAELNAATREASLAQQDADFQNFFHPPAAKSTANHE